MNLHTVQGPQDLEGLFDKYQPLQGKDWLRSLPPEDRQVFSWIGRSFARHGKLGGKARAKTAQRCKCGKFVSSNGKGICDKCQNTNPIPF